jgi:catechol 2,3-dioxygenase-like lactoylglutathione lyase family enzyme
MFHGFFPILSTSDPERLAAFYCDSFDFRETYRFPADGRADFVVVTLGETALAFTREGPDVRPLELCIETEDVDGAVARAEAHVLQPPADQEWGDRTAWIADPDGNVVQLFKPRPRDA